MDRLSSSPRIVDIYAYCGTAMIAEHMKARIRHRIYTYPGLIAQEELDLIQAANDNQVVPQNNLTSMEKLDMAIDMAESVVTLHGYPAGMIIHFDLHTSQFLLSSNKGVLKLNDFNDAKILSYNPKWANYCPDRGCSNQILDSPEELACRRVDEKVDVYMLGNLFYYLLTGLRPFYQYEADDTHGPCNAVRAGKTPFVDERYRSKDFIYYNLVAIMELCWARKSRDRISIFGVTKMLRKVKRISSWK